MNVAPDSNSGFLAVGLWIISTNPSQNSSLTTHIHPPSEWRWAQPSTTPTPCSLSLLIFTPPHYCYWRLERDILCSSTKHCMDNSSATYLLTFSTDSDLHWTALTDSYSHYPKENALTVSSMQCLLLQSLLPATQHTQTVPLQVHSKFRLVMNYNYEWELSRTFLSKHFEAGNGGFL